MHLNSYLLFLKYAKEYFNVGNKVLEIGTATVSDYQKAIDNEQHVVWYTLELNDLKNSRQILTNHIETADPYQYDIKNDTFDIILSGQVAEHVKKLWLWLNELKRITKPGGYIIMISPVSWPYHEDPVDCWRMYPEAVAALSEECELRLVHASWESLEWTHFGLKEEFLKIPGFAIPGISIADENFKIFHHNKQKYVINSLLKWIPVARRFLSPIQVAYDTIAIMQK